jgi:5'-3' exonuclease
MLRAVKVHLVDGTYELFRAFYGAPPMADADGREVGAVRGVERTLRALVEREGATHVAVAFDTVIESFRNRLFPGYKTGDGIDPVLWAQFPLVEEAVERAGFVVLRMVEFEADDALATLAARLEPDPRVEEIVICSPDKDLAQCIRGTRVVCRDRRQGITTDEAGLREKRGIAPWSVPDWLALVGDTADGIPGVPRWGEKSASAVLGRYEKLEAIPDDPGRWEIAVRGRDALATSLRERRADAGLYRTLATLRTDVPIDAGLDDLAVPRATR